LKHSFVFGTMSSDDVNPVGSEQQTNTSALTMSDVVAVLKSFQSDLLEQVQSSVKESVLVLRSELEENYNQMAEAIEEKLEAFAAEIGSQQSERQAEVDNDLHSQLGVAAAGGGRKFSSPLKPKPTPAPREEDRNKKINKFAEWNPMYTPSKAFAPANPKADKKALGQKQIRFMTFNESKAFEEKRREAEDPNGNEFSSLRNMSNFVNNVGGKDIMAPNIVIATDQFATGKYPQYNPENLRDVSQLLRHYYRVKANSRVAVQLKSFLTTKASMKLALLAPRHLGKASFNECLDHGGGVLILPDEEILYLLKVLVRPVNREDFIMKLTESVEFPDSSKTYDLSFGTYERFHQELLEYIRSFFQNIIILTGAIHEDSLDRVLPPLTNKTEPLGFMKLFNRKIPFNQDQKLHSAVCERYDLSDFETINQYVEVVVAISTEVYDSIRSISITCKFNGIALPPSGSSKSSATTSKESSDAAVRFEKRASSFTSSPSSRRFLARPQSLRNVEEEALFERFEADDISHSEATSRKEELEMEADDLDQVIDYLSAVERAAKATTKGPCFTKMRDGFCKDSACPYKHEDSFIKQAIMLRVAQFTKYPLFRDTGMKVVFPPDFKLPPPQPARRTPGAVNYLVETSADSQGLDADDLHQGTDDCN
jgi:hypothetical protein